MNKLNIIAAAVIAGTLSASALADDGKINFVGSLTDDSCTVTNNVSNPLTVTLGNVATSTFTGKGSTAAPTKFTIALTACPEEAKTATVTFDGTADSLDNTMLALTQDTGVATGVGIKLTDVSNKHIPLFTKSDSFTLAEGANNLDFVARYYATKDAVTSGPANSTANFTIHYN